MTRGEKYAWIWVWTVLAVLSLAVPLTLWRYWVSPTVYLNSFLCSAEKAAVAAPACERLLSHGSATKDMRLTANRRLGGWAQSSGRHEAASKYFGELIALGSANDDDWNERGLSFYYSGKYEAAATHFSQAAMMNGTIGAYWSNLGDAQLQVGKFSEAIQNYTTAMRKGFNGAEILGNRAWARYLLGSFANALQDYDKAIAMDAAHADNLNERGLVRQALRDQSGALADFDQALKLDKDNFSFLTNRAMAHSIRGNYDHARQDLDRAIAVNADYRPARLERAWLLINTGQSEKALPELKEAERLGPIDIFLLEARGSARLALGRSTEAIADAEQAMVMNSLYNWPYQLRAKARQDIADYQGSIADSTILLKRDPANIDALVTRALSFQFSGQLAAGLDDMDDVIKTNTDPAFGYEMRSYMNLLAGRLAEALSDAKQLVALAPQSVDSSVTLGWAYLEGGAPAVALAECNRALSIQETDYALRCRATAYLQLNQPEAALIDANRAMALNKAAGNNHLLIGRVDLAHGNAAGAKLRFDEALKWPVYDRAAIYMYRGDAERALGDLTKARLDYQEAKKRDLGLYAGALADRLSAISRP